MTANSKEKKIFTGIYNIADRKFDLIDVILMTAVFAICYMSFIQGDILITGNHSFIMQSNPLSFYDKCYEWSGLYAANYLPSTFILFAIWNLPLRLIGHVPAGLFTNSLLNMLWYKMLPLLFVIASAFLIEKICFQMGMDKIKSKVARYAFIMAPLTLFCMGIFGQYDIFTVFFMLLGYLYYIKGNRYRFILFFAIAITFKYQALLYFAVFLLLKEKGIIKIIRDVILVVIPTVIEILIYLPSPAFRPSVFGFGALTYIDSSIGLGGLRSVNLFFLLMIILAVAAYVIRPKEGEEIQWSIFFANAVSFVFYGFVAFHPQWLLLCVPFTVLAVMRTRHSKILLLIQNVLIIALYCLVVNVWTGNVDQQMMTNGVFKRFTNYGWAVKMKDILSYDNEVYLFTAIFAVLLLTMILSHPKFMQKDVNVIEKDTMVNIRIAFIVAFLGWAVPSFICLKAAVDGKFQMYEEEYSEGDTPITLTSGNIISQEFDNTAKEIYSLKVLSANLNHTNDVSLNISFIDDLTGTSAYTSEIVLDNTQTDGWIELASEPIKLKEGKYHLEISSSEDEEHCIVLFKGCNYNEDKELTINNELQDGCLVFQAKGKK
jgi:hypothetical protein